MTPILNADGPIRREKHLYSGISHDFNSKSGTPLKVDLYLTIKIQKVLCFPVYSVSFVSDIIPSVVIIFARDWREVTFVE